MFRGISHLRLTLSKVAGIGVMGSGLGGESSCRRRWTMIVYIFC
jgi:hypothetical protein